MTCASRRQSIARSMRYLRKNLQDLPDFVSEASRRITTCVSIGQSIARSMRYLRKNLQDLRDLTTSTLLHLDIVQINLTLYSTSAAFVSEASRRIVGLSSAGVSVFLDVGRIRKQFRARSIRIIRQIRGL